MNERLRSEIEFLKALSVEIHRRAEVAELIVEQALPALNQLAAVQLTNRRLILGPVVLRRPYEVQREPAESGQVIQAALALPQGFGCVVWDSEDLAALEDTAQEYEAQFRFKPVADCSPAIKALLLPHLETLLAKLVEGISTPPASPSN